MENFWPADLPAEATCSNCGDTWELQASFRWLYDQDGNKKPDHPTYDIPTSKRRQYIVFCACGRRLADILDPHWPGGASSGYVEDPPDSRTA